MDADKKLLITIGKGVQRCRIDKGWSQEKLGLKTKLHRTYIGSIERGERNMSFCNLSRIALALGVTVTSLSLAIE